MRKRKKLIQKKHQDTIRSKLTNELSEELKLIKKEYIICKDFDAKKKDLETIKKSSLGQKLIQNMGTEVKVAPGRFKSLKNTSEQLNYRSSTNRLLNAN